MSGIAGILHFDGRPAEESLVRAMATAMDYRGPDGMRTWCSGSAALAHCALVSTSEQLEEMQPLQDESGHLVLVFDGRLDNRPEVRRELLAGGARLRDDSDAELVLRAFERWGSECVVHLDGDFALVAWDARTATAVCARDRMGLRPFHYHWDGATLVFASDVHALLKAPWVPQHLNTGMVAEALAMEYHCVRETFWQGVLRLPAATAARVTAAGVRERRYWEPDPGMRLPCRTEADHVAYHRELLFDVVRRQSRSHKPLGCEVSGGLDSSALFAVGHALQRQDACDAPALHGFALAFSDELADESAYQKVLGEHVGAAIERVEPGRYPVSWYRQFCASYRDFAGYPNWTMMRPLYAAARSRSCVALLNGTGGDEWLGYVIDWRSAGLAAGRWSAVFASIRDDADEGGWAHALAGVARWAASEILPDSWQERLWRYRGFAVPSTWLSVGLAQSLRGRRSAMRFGRSVRAGQLEVLRSAFGQLARELAERQAAICGIERRQPFWDRRIVEAAFATPEWMRSRDGEDKWLHRRTMDGLLPQAILERADKAIFSATARQQRPEVTAAVQDVLSRRSSWVRSERVRPPAEYAGRGAMAEFAQWALVMADALEPSDAFPQAVFQGT